MVRATKTTLQRCCPCLNSIFTNQFALAVQNFKNIMQCTRPTYYLTPNHVNKLANTNRTRISQLGQRYTICQWPQKNSIQPSHIRQRNNWRKPVCFSIFIISQSQCREAYPSSQLIKEFFLSWTQAHHILKFWIFKMTEVPTWTKLR